jgi:hypothetical protein
MPRCVQECPPSASPLLPRQTEYQQLLSALRSRPSLSLRRGQTSWDLARRSVRTPRQCAPIEVGRELSEEDTPDSRTKLFVRRTPHGRRAAKARERCENLLESPRQEPIEAQAASARAMAPPQLDPWPAVQP